MYRYLLLLLLLFSLPLQALELFGQNLSATTRDAFRAAVKQSGAKLLSEAGKDAFFDVYEGSGLLPNASRLYLGFVKQDNRFAFVEYEFNGLQQPAMLARLQQKYGKPDKKPATFISDIGYRWQVDGIQIELYQDWSNYKTRLSYKQQAALQQLRAEQRQFQLNQFGQALVFNEKAY